MKRGEKLGSRGKDLLANLAPILFAAGNVAGYSHGVVSLTKAWEEQLRLYGRLDKIRSQIQDMERREKKREDEIPGYR